jgi:septum formation protein
MPSPHVVLASTSRYRAGLLRRLLDDFEQVAPGVDERALSGGPPAERAVRLAIAKAEAVSRHRPGALVIGSDQVAVLGDAVLHKPGSIENAHQQLRASSGNIVDFHTGVCVIDSRDGRIRTHADHTRVVFRALSDGEIERYVARERPLDCAGSFKSEGAGAALFDRIETQDPAALIGLPLIALARLLREAGIAVP